MNVRRYLPTIEVNRFQQDMCTPGWKDNVLLTLQYSRSLTETAESDVTFGKTWGVVTLQGQIQ